MNVPLAGVWIAPDESLPEPGTDVLVAYHDIAGDWNGDETVQIGFLREDGTWMLSSGKLELMIEPVAWQPLPAFPTAIAKAAA